MTVVRLYAKDSSSGTWQLQPYGAIIGHPNVAIMNAMACRMYRNTRLVRYRSPVLSGISTAAQSKPMAFAEPDDLSIEIRVREDNCGMFFEGTPSNTKL